jgi:hypothetical protein
MTMPQGKHVSDLTLEQYQLGELTSDQERRIREELERSPELRIRLDSLQESDRELAAAYPAERVVPQIKERMFREGFPDAGSRLSIPRLAWAVPFAAMIVLIATFSMTNVMHLDGVSGIETRMKGMSPHLSVFRKTMSGAEELRPGTFARQGDVLQLSYAAGAARYGVIFSIDGRGTVTWHVPAGYRGGKRTAALLGERGGSIVLSSAYELDDAPGFERFFLVYGSTPFEVADVERAINALTDRPSTADRDPLSLPRALGQYSLLVKK